MSQLPALAQGNQRDEHPTAEERRAFARRYNDQFLGRITDLNRSLSADNRSSYLHAAMRSRAFTLRALAPKLAGTEPQSEHVKDRHLDQEKALAHLRRVAKIRSRMLQVSRRDLKISPAPKPVEQPSASLSRNRSMDVGKAIDNLAQCFPHYSSRTTLTKTQALQLVCAVLFLAFALIFNTLPAIYLMMGAFSTFYLGCVLLRGMLLARYTGKQCSPTRRQLHQARNGELPVYSVLVALYQEAGQVQRLTECLSRMNWPKDRLEIKLICEADDSDTISAIGNCNLPPQFELIRVPAAHPRTKPKALNYALQTCTGTYLALYDAEDEPHPDQLLEAHLKFCSGPDKLACVQAPLHIHNRSQSWLTRLFAIEYYTLFNGILPILSEWKMPIPLGGTSNHFRLSILEALQGWDPYNVTEDADLGIRLAREGYHCETITLPTWEEAPPDFGNWLPQRTRWLKGWMQTILVHSRTPIAMCRQIGIKPFAMFHLMMTSIVISSLFHPIFIILGIYQFSQYEPSAHQTGDAIVVASIFILVGGYTTYAALATLVLESCEKNELKKYLWSIPVYWFLISIAGWRAVWQLAFKPHMWEKTKHGLAIRHGDTTL